MSSFSQGGVPDQNIETPVRSGERPSGNKKGMWAG